MRLSLVLLLAILPTACKRPLPAAPALVHHELQAKWTIELHPELQRRADKTSVVFTANGRTVQATTYDNYEEARRTVPSMPVTRSFKQGQKTAEVFDVAANREIVLIRMDDGPVLRLDIAAETPYDQRWMDSVWQSVRHAP